jgi:hypothetical protein
VGKLQLAFHCEESAKIFFLKEKRRKKKKEATGKSHAL